MLIATFFRLRVIFREIDTNLIAALDLDPAIVDAHCLERREEVLHGAHPRAAAAQRGAERRVHGVLHRRGNPRPRGGAGDEVPPLSGHRREEPRGGAGAGVEPRPRHGDRRG